MPLDPALALKLHLMQDINTASMTADAQARIDEFYQDPEPWTAPSTLAIQDVTAAGPHGPVPVRIYRPIGRSSGRALVWAHGGGFAYGDLDMAEAHIVSAELAMRSGSAVISVGYRLAANGVRFPVPVDDVHAVWTWVTSGSASKNGHKYSSVSLGGASAGAALALSTARRLLDRREAAPASLLLAYPFLHYPNPALDPEISVELSILPAVMRFPAANIESMVRNYVGRITNVPVEAMPGNGNLDGLPEVRLIVSEYDDLRSSAELFERQLTELGIPVKKHLAEGMPHGHLNRGTSLKAVVDSLNFFAEGL
jgi:acetyl esterase